MSPYLYVTGVFFCPPCLVMTPKPSPQHLTPTSQKPKLLIDFGFLLLSTRHHLEGDDFWREIFVASFQLLLLVKVKKTSSGQNQTKTSNY